LCFNVFLLSLQKKNMSTVYQPFIIEEANRFVESLEQSGFFIDFEIEDKNFALNYFCEKLTEKFIQGTLDENIYIFTDEEMDTFLNEIMVGSILFELQKDGIVDFIEDENNEERFFLTEKGKKIAKKIDLEERN
jgi:hypothetical protein